LRFSVFISLINAKSLVFTHWLNNVIQKWRIKILVVLSQSKLA